jgi:hypothetical protein
MITDAMHETNNIKKILHVYCEKLRLKIQTMSDLASKKDHKGVDRPKQYLL